MADCPFQSACSVHTIAVITAQVLEVSYWQPQVCIVLEGLWNLGSISSLLAAVPVMHAMQGAGISSLAASLSKTLKCDARGGGSA